MPPGEHRPHRARVASRCRATQCRRPRRPPSRYSKLGAPGGVITNGGFDTTRSNCSPATGSSNEPWRRSHAAGGALRRAVELGEREGALGDVGGDHLVGVVRGVQRLDPAAGAQVEHAADGRAHRDRRQGRRGPADAEHVVALELARRSRSSPRSDATHHVCSPSASANAYGPHVDERATPRRRPPPRPPPPIPQRARAVRTERAAGRARRRRAVSGLAKLNSRVRSATGSRPRSRAAKRAGTICSRSSALHRPSPTSSETASTVHRRGRRAGPRGIVTPDGRSVLACAVMGFSIGGPARATVPRAALHDRPRQ